MQRDTAQSVISAEEFQELVHPLIGLPVSRVWRGAGSAIFLEIGKLFKETWWYPKKKRKATSIMNRWYLKCDKRRPHSFG